jgi:F0F1-type ATP synthase assembly protein I
MAKLCLSQEQPTAIMFAAVGLQVGAVSVLGVLTGLMFNWTSAFFFALGGMAAVAPNGLFALRLALEKGRSPESCPAVFFLGEFAKIGLTAGLLAWVVHHVMPEVRWLPLVLGLIVALKAPLFALLLVRDAPLELAAPGAVVLKRARGRQRIPAKHTRSHGSRRSRTHPFRIHRPSPSPIFNGTGEAQKSIVDFSVINWDTVFFSVLLTVVTAFLLRTPARSPRACRAASWAPSSPGGVRARAGALHRQGRHLLHRAAGAHLVRLDNALMNAMNLLPLDLLPKLWEGYYAATGRDPHHAYLRVVPTATSTAIVIVVLFLV